MYNKYRTVDSALKNQLLTVFENPYLATRKHEYTGYDTRYTMELISHLYKNYALISSTDMAANNKILCATYNTEDLLESLIESINECADFATTASEPVMETQIFCIAYGLFSEIGHYLENYWAWRNQDDKYWKHFQANFIEA